MIARAGLAFGLRWRWRWRGVGRGERLVWIDAEVGGDGGEVGGELGEEVFEGDVGFGMLDVGC